MTIIKSSAQRVQEALKKFDIEFQVITFDESTRTSQEAANAIGCHVAQIAKTLIFKGEQSGNAICVIASGINRVDEKKVAQLIGEPIKRADADFVREKTGYAIGGVAPVGFELPIKPLIDQDLMTYEEIWAAAGTPNSVFKLKPHELLQISGGQAVDVKKIISKT